MPSLTKSTIDVHALARHDVHFSIGDSVANIFGLLRSDAGAPDIGAALSAAS